MNLPAMLFASTSPRHRAVRRGLSGGYCRRGFTLIEVLVSCAIFVLIIAVITGIINSASSVWVRQRSQSASFEAANAGFLSLTRSLSQAVLNTSWQVTNNQYGRSSDLHFIMGPATDVLGQASAAEFPGSAIFFQAPLGRPSRSGVNSAPLRRLPNLLNGLGYFVRFDEGPAIPAFLNLNQLVKPRHRYRLYEWIQPTEEFSVYHSPGGSITSQRAWFRTDVAAMRHASVLAENVIGLILLAECPESNGDIVPVYDYDSRDATQSLSLNQLPPRIRVLMAVIDEASARRLAEASGTNEPPVYPDASWFQNPAEFANDLGRWEEKLKAIQPSVDYRFFTATVIIQNAKWSF